MSGGDEPDSIPASTPRQSSQTAKAAWVTLVGGLFSGVLTGLFTDAFAALIVALLGLEAGVLLWRSRGSAVTSCHEGLRKRLRFYSYVCVVCCVGGLIILGVGVWGGGLPGPIPVRWARGLIGGFAIYRLYTWRGRRSAEKRLGARLLFFEEGEVRYMARSVDDWLGGSVGSHAIGKPGQTDVLPPIVLVALCVVFGWVVAAPMLDLKSSIVRGEISEHARPVDQPDEPSESTMVGAGGPTAAASMDTGSSTDRVAPSPAPPCASDEAFLAVVGYTPLAQRLVAAWRKVGAVEVGCPSGPPEPWTYLEVVELFGGVSDPSLVVANVDGSAAVVFDDLVGEVRRRADVLTVVEPRTETGRGHYTVLLQEDGSCLLAMRLKSSFPQQVLPEATSAAVFHVAGRVGGVPLSFETAALEDGLRYDVRYTQEDPEVPGTLRSEYVSIFTSEDGSVATWRDEQFGSECPDQKVRAALAWEAQKVRDLVDNQS